MSETTNPPVVEKPTAGRVRHWLWRWTRRALIVLGLFVAMLVVLVLLMSVFYRVENKKGKEAWAACQADLIQKGEKLDVTSFIPASVPDEQNFASAPILVAIFDASREDEVRKARPELALEGNYHYPIRNWLQGQKTDLIAWQQYYRGFTNLASLTHGTNAAETVLRVVDRYGATFAQLREYGRRPKTDFHIGYDPKEPLKVPYQHFIFIKSTMISLGLRENALLALGRVDEAGQDVDLMLRLADSLKGERFVMTWLVRRALLQITCEAIWDGLADHRWTEAQLQRWQRSLSSVNLVDEFVASMRGERAAGIQMIKLMVNDPEILANELTQRLPFPPRGLAAR